MNHQNSLVAFLMIGLQFVLDLIEINGRRLPEIDKIHLNSKTFGHDGPENDKSPCSKSQNPVTP